MELIVAEKPSAAQKIAQSIGKFKIKIRKRVKYYESHDGKIVIASAVGHLFGLTKNQRFYPVFDLKWAPSFKNSKSSAFSKPYFELLRILGKKSNKLTIATDYDLEGEVIGLNITRELLGRKDANRMKFSTLTADELNTAYNSKSKTLNWGQANAGIVRHTLDWYYGINLSQIIASSVSKALNRYQPMSIGRVQGPTLSILAERELEIEKFKPEPFWQVFANLWLNKQAIKSVHEKNKFFNKSEAKTIFQKIIGKDGTITNISKSKQKVFPPSPFDLTSLQMEAYRLFKYSPSMTLKVAQKLYSNAYISYPRTSSQKLPKSLNFKKILTKLSSNSKYKQIAKQVLTTNLKPAEGRKKDPAHPAIHPTGEKPGKISPYELKIYDLIVKRFFAVFGEVGERESTRIKMDISGENFKFGGVITTKPGWMNWYGSYSARKEVELPSLTVGQILKQNSELEQKETQPPPRYTTASLIKRLENEGLGTKATRSSIIETLEKRNYIQGNPIEVTDFGMNVYYTFKKFSPEILSIALTRKFDKAMDDVQSGKISPDEVIDAAQKSVTKYYAKLKENKEKIGVVLSKSFVTTKKKNVELFSHECGKMLVVRRSRATKKRFIACSGYPKCKFTWPLPQKGVLSVTKNKCDECETIMLQTRTGRRVWKFCPNPDCKSKNEKSK